MATLKLKFKKDDPPFYVISDCTHVGETAFTKEQQRAGMEYVRKKLTEMVEELKGKGYDPQTIRFSVKTTY